MFHGAFTALITPFKDGEVDWKAFDRIVEWQIGEGIHGLVVCGTTGESPTLTPGEHMRLIERCVDVARGRVPVIAGTGSNATSEAIEYTQHAKSVKADAALIVTPYYNKPTQEGLFLHYKKITESADIPIIIYNIPGRCSVDMSIETISRLAKLPNIAGLKDATGDISRVQKTAQATKPDFCQLSGDDIHALEFLEQGGHGCISVASNIAPALCAQMQNLWKAGDKNGAKAVHETLIPLYKALFTETSPQPVKYGMHRLGFCSDEMRLPLIPASAAARKTMDEAMEQTGILPDEKASGTLG